MTNNRIEPEPRLTQESVTLLLQKARGQDEAAIADLLDRGKLIAVTALAR